MKCFVFIVLACVAYADDYGYGHDDHYVEHKGYGGLGDYDHGRDKGYGGDQRMIYHQQNGKSYKFGYDISSPYHHNYNSRHEEGIGGKYVKGRYTLKEKDGSIRVVEYVADHDGVKAVVKDKYGVTYHGYHGGYDDGYKGYQDGHHNAYGYDNSHHNGYGHHGGYY